MDAEKSGDFIVSIEEAVLQSSLLDLESNPDLVSMQLMQQTALIQEINLFNEAS